MLEVRLALASSKIGIGAVTVRSRQDIDIGLGRGFKWAEEQGDQQQQESGYQRDVFNKIPKKPTRSVELRPCHPTAFGQLVLL